MWIGYFAYWGVMSRKVKVTERSESAPSRLLRMVSIVGAMALLWLPHVPLPWLEKRFLPLSA
jgi:hypothetical protein